jgi:colicin import membrane protein
MTANTARMEFAPPPTKGLVRAFGLAVLAHGVLLMALTLGVQWKRDPILVTVEAELWSALPAEAAPPQPPAPEPTPEPPKVPPLQPTIAPPTPAPAVPDTSIAIAQEKARLQKQRELQQEKLELEKRQKAGLQAKKLKDEKEAKEAHDRELRDKLAKDKKLQLEQQKAQAAKSDAENKKLAELRKQQIERMNRLAGQVTGSGGPESTGTAKQSSGPSATYAGRIAARIKPNITYTEPILGNPTADVEVRTSPDGTIISRKLIKSSGVKSWDDAVLNAVDKTEKLPPDTDGRVIPSLTLGFRPRD